MVEPKEYDMSNFDDIERWFIEMEGYLKTEDFIHQGTDLEGRKFALDAFRQFKKNFTASLPFMKLTKEKILSKKLEK